MTINKKVLEKISVFDDNLRNDIDSVILFGSYARGSESKISDIDVLLITHSIRKSFTIDGIYSFSVYTLDQLLKLAKESSMFVSHIINESILIQGVNHMERLIQAYDKLDVNDLRENINAASGLLDVDLNTFQEKNDKLIKLQKFIVRSWIYTLAHTELKMSYDIFKCINSLELGEYWSNYFQSRRLNLPLKFSEFKEVNKIASSDFKIQMRNPYRSIEAYIVNNYPQSKLTTALGVRLLEPNDYEFNYENIVLDEW